MGILYKYGIDWISSGRCRYRAPYMVLIMLVFKSRILECDPSISNGQLQVQVAGLMFQVKCCRYDNKPVSEWLETTRNMNLPSVQRNFEGIIGYFLFLNTKYFNSF